MRIYAHRTLPHCNPFFGANMWASLWMVGVHHSHNPFSFKIQHITSVHFFSRYSVFFFFCFCSSTSLVLFFSISILSVHCIPFRFFAIFYSRCFKNLSAVISFSKHHTIWTSCGAQSNSKYHTFNVKKGYKEIDVNRGKYIWMFDKKKRKSETKRKVSYWMEIHDEMLNIITVQLKWFPIRFSKRIALGINFN